MDFQTYRRPLVAVEKFKYPGRVLKASDDDWPAVVGNLREARKRWARMSRILGWEGELPRTYGKFYKLFGTESWVMSPKIGRTLGGLHNRVDLRMANMQLRRTRVGR